MIALSLLTAAIIASSVQLPPSLDSSASIHGTAISSYNGLPLVGVIIFAPGTQKLVITDTNGRFELRGLPAGRQTIQVSYDGRVTEAYVFELQHQHAKRIAVLLDVYAEDLDPLVVEAREANIWRDLGGFYERRHEYAGFAHFFTREEISHMRASTISGLLTAEGIVTRCSPACWPMRMNRGRLCQVSVSVNGVSQREPDYNAIQIADVTGVEVYRGVPPADLSRSMVPNSSPSSIWMGTGMSAAGQCGLVEIWTR
jgi:hypothetical protein